jgi:hypothetical protein
MVVDHAPGRIFGCVEYGSGQAQRRMPVLGFVE